ncbi:hypothetical protein DIJ60_07815 [Burkholderia pseudomallei]|nr:hypothetical protein DIJ60_07815 [Burkholderia pseudomallei]
MHAIRAMRAAFDTHRLLVTPTRRARTPAARIGHAPRYCVCVAAPPRSSDAARSASPGCVK